MRVNEDKFFPADILVLNSTEPEGGFYVETKNLDGETNLKLKSAPKDVYESFIDDQALDKLSGILKIEVPNNRIYKFDGSYDMTSMQGKTGL